MEHDVLEKISEELSFEELSEITRTALSSLYRKLQTEEGFGYYQCCSITSIGSNEYDVNGLIMDNESHNLGVDWPRTFWF